MKLKILGNTYGYPPISYDTGSDERCLEALPRMKAALAASKAAAAASAGHLLEAEKRLDEALAIFRCRSLRWEEVEARCDCTFGQLSSDEKGTRRQPLAELAAELEIYGGPGAGAQSMERMDSDQHRCLQDQDGASRPPDQILTRRQMEVLRLVTEGKSNREIANQLVLSDRTIQRHIADTYRKIGAHNRVEATKFLLNEMSKDI